VKKRTSEVPAGIPDPGSSLTHSEWSYSSVRIVIGTSWFPSTVRPHSAPFVRDFVVRLANYGLEVWLFTPYSPVLAGALSKGAEIQCVWGFKGPIVFAATILETRDSILHVQSPNMYSSIFIIVAKLLRKPVVATIHRSEVAGEFPRVIRYLRRFVLRSIDMTICVSDFTRNLALTAGSSPDSTVTIHNAADEDFFKPRPRDQARENLGLPLDNVLVLYVGNLVPIKGCAALIRAFAELKREAKLLIIGEGPLKEDLHELTRQLGISQKVLFLGQLSRRTLAPFYNASDFFVLNSLVEGNSVALLEAMASGIPAIVTRVGGNAEAIIESESGLLVEPGDKEGLTRAIGLMAESAELRRKMGERARGYYLSKFSSKVQLEETIVLYRKLLTERSSV
jgi:glycosyltransferase involved in cell wall biosynthesis